MFSTMFECLNYIICKITMNNIMKKNENNTTLNNKQTTLFNKPTTLNERQTFHKTNEDGMKIAYSKPEGYHIEGNKLLIAGTRDFGDVMDWPKILLGTFKDSKIYKKYRTNL